MRSELLGLFKAKYLRRTKAWTPQDDIPTCHSSSSSLCPRTVLATSGKARLLSRGSDFLTAGRVANSGCGTFSTHILLGVSQHSRGVAGWVSLHPWGVFLPKPHGPKLPSAGLWSGGNDGDIFSILHCNLDSISKSRDITLLTKVHKAMVFPVVTYRYERWTINKAECWRIAVLDKTLESPLDSKGIKPVNPKGNQPWICIGRTDAPIHWSPDVKSWHLGKYLDAGKDWEQEEKRMTEDKIASPTQWIWISANSRK